ncbi:carbohydrate-binding module family 18 protein, partial [Melanomma pulvis-pyrius CBS 109.77]
SSILSNQGQQISTSAAPSSIGLLISQDGRCGLGTGQTCLDSAYGDCCNSSGRCGYTDAYCAVGCNPEYGFCFPYTLDGTCGLKAGYSCVNPSNGQSDFGPCCGSNGICGSGQDACGTGK